MRCSNIDASSPSCYEGSSLLFRVRGEGRNLPGWGTPLLSDKQTLSQYSIDVKKRSNKNLKNVENVKKRYVTKIKKTFVNVIKNVTSS